MARQHFYSRVPARVSLYNRCDGFDTFIKSGDLSDGLVRGELRVMYDEKLNIHDPVKVRRGEIPTVYSQMKLESGEVAQTTIKYLPTDFTGERSAYLAHTLVLDAADRAAAFCTNGNECYNAGMFISDISAFRLTDPMAMPNPSISDVAYTPAQVKDGPSPLSKYNPEVVKGMLYAVANSLCEGGEVCFRLPVADSEASDEALAVINTILGVLPYEMRERLSFASFVSRLDAYRGFKLRCISSDCAVGRGTCLYDFKAELITAPPKGYENYIPVASFLYSIADNKRVRDEFLAFSARVGAKYDLHITSMKTLSEIILLFWQCSGFYVESSILPTDDTIISFLDVYEKYRDGLTTEHRVRAYRPLARYSSKQIAIPTAIFDRMKRLYVDECVQAKAVALDVALHLIHVDAMRDRLFSFIVSNYDRELDSVKAVVNENLARVFYGGFLQEKILNFFAVHFILEPVSTRDIILDKLLLTIRTPEIQRQIIAFLDRQYDRMNQSQRMKIYSTCLEMIPECDALSAMLVGYINRHITKENEEICAQIGGRLLQILDRSLKSGDSRITAIFVNENGFCEELTAKYILTQHVGSEMFSEILAGMPPHKRAEKLINIRRSYKGMTESDYVALVCSFDEREINLDGSTAYEIMAIDEKAAKQLKGETLASFRRVIINPALSENIYDVFKVKLGKEGTDAVIRFAEGREDVKSSEQYGVLEDYLAMVKCALAGDAPGAFGIVDKMPDDRHLRVDIAEHLLMVQLDRANQSELTVCIMELIISYFRTGTFRFDTLYPRYKKHFEEIRQDESNVIKDKLSPADRLGAADAMELILGCIRDICEISDELADDVCDAGSGLKKAFAAFFKIWGAGARVYLKKHFENGYEGVVDIMDELVEERNSDISSFGELSDLFTRKFRF